MTVLAQMQATGDPRGYYQILGVSQSASPDDVRRAFRRRAMDLHPDHHDAGPNESEDFRRLCEAYEVLRDPKRRMAYDANGRDDDWTIEDPDLEADLGAAPVERDRAGLFWPLAAALLGFVVLGLTAMLWSANGRAGAREAALIEMQAQLDVARRDQANLRARYRDASLDPGDPLGRLEARAAQPNNRYVFQVDLAFPRGMVGLDDGLRRRLNRAVVDLARVIGTIPAGRDWVILVEGGTDAAALTDGVAVSTWETALLRLGSVVDHLVAHDVPAKRLVVRFQTGLGADAEPETGTVEMKLLCCFY